MRLIKKLLEVGAKYKNIINYKCQSFLSLMGEAALRDKFNEESNNKKTKFIDVDKENKEAKIKMEEYIKKNSNKKNIISLFSTLIPFVILIISYFINKMAKAK